MSVGQQVQQRIGDAERERAVARLGEHVGAGRLDLAEFESRSAAVYAARTRADLDTVFADLPAIHAAPRREREARAVHRIVMASVWGSWLVSGVVCLAIWAIVAVAQGSPGYFWPLWVIGPWGVMLAIGTLTGGRMCGSRRIA
jgi:hypothetical protein